MTVSDNNEDRSGNVEHKWYVVHTYSGYENRVEQTLWERVRQNDAESLFSEVLVPREKEVEGAERRGPARKFFPGYIFVKMELNTESWHIVSGTPRVSGFVGGGKDPGRVRPVPEHEVLRITDQMEEAWRHPSRFSGLRKVNPFVLQTGHSQTSMARLMK